MYINIRTDSKPNQLEQIQNSKAKNYVMCSIRRMLFKLKVILFWANWLILVTHRF